MLFTTETPRIRELINWDFGIYFLTCILHSFLLRVSVVFIYFLVPASAFSVCSAVKFKDIPISLENSTVHLEGNSISGIFNLSG